MLESGSLTGTEKRGAYFETGNFFKPLQLSLESLREGKGREGKSPFCVNYFVICQADVTRVNYRSNWS